MAEQTKASDKAGEKVLDVTEQAGPTKGPPTTGGDRPGEPRSVPKGWNTR